MGWGMGLAGVGGTERPGPSLAAAVGGARLGHPESRGAPQGLSSLLPLGGSGERSIPQHPHLPALPAELDRRQTPPRPPSRLLLRLFRAGVPGLIPGWGPMKGTRRLLPALLGPRCGVPGFQWRVGPAARTGRGAVDPCRQRSPVPLPGSGNRHPAQSGALTKGMGCPRPIRAGTPNSHHNSGDTTRQAPPRPARRAPQPYHPGLQRDPRLRGVTPHTEPGPVPGRPAPSPQTAFCRTGVISATPLQTGGSVPDAGERPMTTQDAPQSERPVITQDAPPSARQLFASDLKSGSGSKGRGN